ncbi:hypothetical protein E1J23_22395 [Xanthomonas gardneri]|nr:hypothetical protein [Xanthomonas hortorum pv. gardneri]
MNALSMAAIAGRKQIPSRCRSTSKVEGAVRSPLAGRCESIPGGSVAVSMPPHGPAIGEDTAPDRLLCTLLKNRHTDKARR